MGKTKLALTTEEKAFVLKYAEQAARDDSWSEEAWAKVRAEIEAGLYDNDPFFKLLARDALKVYDDLKRQGPLT